MPEITGEQLAYSIAKLDVRRGDILVFKLHYRPSKEEYLAIQRQLHATTGGRCKFIILSPDADLEVVQIENEGEPT